MSEGIQHFLLMYDREHGVLVETREFGEDIDRAMTEYRQAEEQHSDNRRMDIVLVGAEDIESVKVTHSNYFRTGVRDIESYLADFYTHVQERLKP